MEHRGQYGLLRLVHPLEAAMNDTLIVAVFTVIDDVLLALVFVCPQ